MQKSTILLLLSCVAIVVLSVGLSSCSKDDDPATPPKLSFDEESMTVDEGEGTIEVKVKLDKAYSKDITVEYSVGGSAVEGTSGTSDYEIQGSFGEVDIDAGQTEGIIEIEIRQDAIHENDETIELSIEDVDDENVDITNDDEIEITIEDDDVAILASFATSEMSADENDGILNVTVSLSEAATENITVQYALSGTARDSVSAVSATPKLSYDYSIKGSTSAAGQVVIPSGQTSAIIKVKLLSDLLLEDGDVETDPFDAEVITITLTAASGVGAIDETKKVTDISVNQEDGLLIFLTWPEPDATPGKEADMDLLLRVGNEEGTWLGIFTGSAATSNEAPEFIFLPKIVNFTYYGLSYPYYSGDMDPLDFEVIFAEVVDGNFESEATVETFEATYTLTNINEWEDPSTTIVVQTFEKEDGDFTSPTEITVPTTGSRISSPQRFTSTFKKNDRAQSQINAIAKRVKALH